MAEVITRILDFIESDTKRIDWLEKKLKKISRAVVVQALCMAYIAVNVSNLRSEVGELKRSKGE